MQTRRSYYTAEQIIVYLDAPLKSIFQTEKENNNWEFILDNNNVPTIESVIMPEEDKIIAMGFPCIKERNLALLPIVAAFVQYSLIQRSNQQLAVPYSQITTSYRDAINFLENNKNLCKQHTSSIRGLIASRTRRRVNSGW